MNKTISVWTIVEDGEKKGMLPLQKRLFKDTKFPSICQPTWAGKIEDGENIALAIERECKEELGELFFNCVDFSKLKLFSRDYFLAKGKKSVCYNYCIGITDAMLQKAKLHHEADSEFIFIDEKDEVHPMTSKKDPKNNIVLFDDQYKVLKNILHGAKRNNQ